MCYIVEMKLGDKVYIDKTHLPENFFESITNDKIDYVVITAIDHRLTYPYGATVYFIDGSSIAEVLFRKKELISISDIKKNEFNKNLGNL